MPNLAPYKIEKRGDKYVVLNNAGEAKATFKSYAQAQDYLSALYANVPGAGKKAAKTKWTGKAKPFPPKKAAASAAELAERWAPTLGRKREDAVSQGLPEITDRESLLAAIENASGYVEQRAHIIEAAEGLGLKDLIPAEWLGVGPVLTADQQVATDTLVGLMGGSTYNGIPGTTFTPAPVYSTGTVSSIQPIYTNPLVPPAPAPAPVVEEARAFTTEINGKAILTAPAHTIADAAEKAAAGNKHYLWVAGRFVGAEAPNRNNAYWSSGDLELGQASVANGPLNWLHEARHVIGTIAKADYIPGSTPGPETAGETVQPHIAATSVVWPWIYPDEAWVLEQASDAGKLWYSMECISDSVKCRADGCNAEVAYAAYLNDLGCGHMRERSSVRHFANPTFLGGAVIVPPARPGWADADASILTQAASMAEKAFDQAGRPDMPASEWELLMANVVAYARG